MNVEIERKYLVAEPGIVGRATSPPVAIRQAYLATGKTTVRLRIAGVKAWLGVVGARDGESMGYEYVVPVADAEEMISRLSVTAVVEKDRCLIEDGTTWTVDVFKGNNAPLVVAEVTQRSRTEAIHPPSWLGDEVTHDLRYQNVYLSLHPYCAWRHSG